MHKIHIGLAAVACDILSLTIITYFFYKLKSIDREYLEIMDNNLIKMSKFTVQINDLQLDRTVQDFRMLKMQLWLHFDQYFKEVDSQRAAENDAEDQNVFEIADIQLGETDSPKFRTLLILQKYYMQLNSIM